MPRLIGTDTPNPQSQLPTSNAQAINGVDTSQQSLAVAQRSIQNTGNYLQNSIQTQAQMTQKMAESTMQAQESMAKSEFSTKTVTTDNTGKVLSGLADVGGLVLKTLDGIQKRDDQVREQYYKEQYATALQEVSKLQTNAQDLVRNSPGGRTTVERQFEGIMTRYQFKPEDRAKVYNDFYGTLQGIEGENARRRREEFDKVQDSSIEQKKNETLLLVSPRLSMLSVTTDPAKANELRTEIRGILNQAMSNPELDPKTRQTILTAVSSETLQRSFKSTDEQAKIFQLVQNHSNASQEAAVLQTKLTSGELTQMEFENQMILLEGKYPGVSSRFLQTYDPTYNTKRLNDIEQERQNTTVLQQKGEELRFGQATFDDATTGSFAWDLVQNPAQLARFKQEKGNTAPGKAILAVVEQYQKLQEVRQKNREESAAIGLTIARVQQDDAEGVLSLWRTMRPETRSALDGQLGFLKSMFGDNLQPPAQGASPQEVADWQEKVRQASAKISAKRQDVIQALQTQLNAKGEEEATLSRQLQQYGFQPDGTFPKKLYDEALQRRQQTLQKINAEKEAEYEFGNGGNTPPFRQPQLKRVNVGGRQAVLPVPVSANVHVWNNYGQDRGTHRHQGEDLAVPKSTPIVAPMDGKVTIVDKTSDPNGYGYFFEVELADGTKHLFAHNSRIKVRPDQRVRAGEVLALSGGVPGEPGSGRTSGAHIHWEVRDRSERVIDPYAWATSVKIDGTPRYARTGDRTGQRPSNVPKDAIPVKGGFLAANSTGRMVFIPNEQPTNIQDAQYRSSSPLRRNTNSTNIKDYPKRNDPKANYGYSVLAKDQQFAAGVAKISDELGIPAQWLVDVMAYETGGTFSPGIPNKGGAPAVGLIQFYEDSHDPGHKTVGGRRYSLAEIANMTRTQQLRLVRDFLLPFKGQMTEPKHVLGAVFGYNPKLNKESGDGDITFGEYLDRLGSHVGRQYYTNRGRNRATRAMSKIDSKPVASCTMCQQMLAMGTFTPHERIG